MAEHGQAGQTSWEGEMFRLLVENVKDYAIFVLDTGGRVRSWNPGAARLLGYAEDEIVGEPADRFFTPDDVRSGGPQQEMRKAAETGRGEDDRWHVRKDGTRFWSSGVMTPLYDEGGTLQGFAKIMRDLTDVKRAEAAVRDSEAHLRLVADHAPAFISHCGRDRRFKFVNRGYAARFGLTPQEAVGRHVAEVIGEEAYEATRPYVERVLAGEELEYEAEIPYRKIGRRFMRCAYVPQRGPGGEVEGWVAVVSDVTARKEAEDRLRAGEQRFRTLARLAPVGIFQTDAEGNCLFVNEKWCQLSGLTAEAAAGQGWVRALHPEDRERVLAEWDGAVRAGEGFASEYRFRTPDGAVSWLQGSAVALRGGAGEVAGHIGTVTDITERRRAESAVRESEGRFRGLIEQSPFSVQLFAPDGRTLGVNRAWEELWGLTFDQVADYNVLRDPQLEAKGALPHIRRAFAGEPATVPAIRYDPNETIPGRTRHPDPRRWVSAVAYPLKDGAGRVREVVLVHQDITARLRAEEEREKFAFLVENSHDFIGMCDMNLMPFFVNRAGLRLVGLDSLEQALRTPVQEFLFPEDLPFMTGEFFPRVLRDGHGETEIRFRHFKTGEALWMTYAVLALTGAAGERFGLATVSRDVTAQKRAEEALRESERLYRAIGESIDYGVWVCDPQGRNVYVSESFLRLVGLTQEQCSEFGWKAILHPDEAERTIAAWQECVRSGGQWDVEHRFRGVDGRWHPTLARGVPVRNERGEITAWAGINLDISRLKQVEEELREADRRKDEFLATLAHELRNPLAPITNALQILKMPLVDAETARRSREMMERQVHHLVRLVDDLLDVSRVMRGKIELRKERVDLAAAAARAVETAQPAIDAQRHELTVSLPPEPLPLDADPVRLAQVVGNLLTNAAKYTEPNGRIWLSAAREGSQAVLRVRDSGIGIAPEMLPKVFDLFVQVDHSATRSQGGLGIGLTLVKNLVEMHHGTVSAHSEGLGMGTEIVVRLPLAGLPREVPPGQAAGERRPPNPPARHRLLVVDDNRDAADSLAVLLRLLGHEVRVAHGGPAALELVKGYRPAAVFLDIGMPEMDGYEVARRLRRQPGLEGVRLVAVTGWGQREDRRLSAKAGFDHHLVKPAEPAALEGLLAGLHPQNE